TRPIEPGNWSSEGGPKSVGLYVPDTMSAGNAGTEATALSLKVRFALEAERPTSDMSLIPLLPGLARRMSTSCVEVWVKPNRLTETFRTGPGTQRTSIVAG